jgi:hypothetical protein
VRSLNDGAAASGNDLPHQKRGWLRVSILETTFRRGGDEIAPPKDQQSCSLKNWRASLLGTDEHKNTVLQILPESHQARFPGRRIYMRDVSVGSKDRS